VAAHSLQHIFQPAFSCCCCCSAAQVNIYCDCPLWPDDSMCSNRACSVCECGENEVPMPWLAAEQQAAKACKATQSPDCDTEGCACPNLPHPAVLLASVLTWLAC
jgi:ERO1-like protein alpha